MSDHRFNSAPFCGKCGGVCEMEDDPWGIVARQEETIKEMRREILKLNTVIAEARKVLGDN